MSWWAENPSSETRVDKIHTLRSVFDVRQLKVLPKVVIIYGYRDDPGICTMRRSPIMPTVLSTPEPGRGRCRYVAPPVSKSAAGGHRGGASLPYRQRRRTAG